MKVGQLIIFLFEQSLSNLSKMRILCLVLFSQALINAANSQSLNVNFQGIHDTLRRNQITGKENISSSFTILPQDIVAYDSSGVLSTYQITKPVYSLKKLNLNISAIVPTLRTEFHSHHPYYSNNGAIQPSKGLASLWSTGVTVRHKYLSIQIRPEFILSENKDYDGFPQSFEGFVLQQRYEFWNRIDEPESFGATPKSFFTWGQSHILATIGSVGLGVSSENLWWGPGKRNTLLMTNNARGFEHLTFRTIKPISTVIGSLEWQVVAGRLEASGYDPPFSTLVNRTTAYFSGRINEKRYLNAATLTYSPKWVKGLSLGAARSFQMYSSLARSTRTYLPIVLNFFRDNDGDRNETEIDQLFSSFARWYWQDADMELYFEFGRNDASLNLRDLLISPRHSRAYVFGFSKIFQVGENQFELNYEHTELSQTINRILVDAGSWYHHTFVRHGYTNYGEVMGAGIGPGSDMDHISISYVDGPRKVGLILERLSHQNDFYYRTWDNISDFRRFWIDYSAGINGIWDFGPVMIDGQLLFTRTLNYQWVVNDPGNRVFSGGRDLWNIALSLNASYFF